MNFVPFDNFDTNNRNYNQNVLIIDRKRQIDQNDKSYKMSNVLVYIKIINDAYPFCKIMMLLLFWLSQTLPVTLRIRE